MKRSKFGMEISEMQRLEALEDETRRLKQIGAGQTPNLQTLKAIVVKQWRRMIVVVLTLVVAGAEPFALQKSLSYDEFIRMTDKGRAEAFAAATPEQKATLKRTRAERWLAQHQKDLSKKQVQVMQSAIAFITADLYRAPLTEQEAQAEARIKHDLECHLGRVRVTEAFTFFLPDTSIEGKIDEWLAWFSNCLE